MEVGVVSKSSLVGEHQANTPDGTEARENGGWRGFRVFFGW